MSRHLRFSLWLSCALLAAGSSICARADPEDAQYNVVVSLSNAGQWEAALSKIAEREKVPSQSDATKARYLHARGLICERAGRAGDAAAAYRSLLAAHPNAPEAAKARLALLYLDYAAGRPEAVIEAYPRIAPASLDPADQRNVALMYAESLWIRGDSAKAVPAYETALRLGADAAAIRPRLFSVYLKDARHRDLLALSSGGVPGVETGLVLLARAEAFLAAGSHREAEAEAARIPAADPLHARASYARARALIGLGRPADAVAPLSAAIAGMRDPAAPPAAYAALAECLAGTTNATAAAVAVREARKRTDSLAADERARTLARLALLEVSLATAAGDSKRIIEAVRAAREQVPPDQRTAILYARLYALDQQHDGRGILETLAADYPEIQKGPEDAPATLIYYRALKEAGRLDEGQALLTGLIVRRPKAPEATHARQELAAAAMDRHAYREALPLLGAILADSAARQALGPKAYAGAAYNRGLAALKAGDTNAAVESFGALLREKPDAALRIPAQRIMGRICADRGDYRGAAAAWRDALAGAAPEDEGGLRELLGQALTAAGDAAGADAEFAKAAALKGGASRLSADANGAWARALYQAGRFTNAAARYADLYQIGKDPARAYEAAAAFDKASRTAEAAEWYARAAGDRGRLPASYATNVEACLASARARAGVGDLGAGHWLKRLGPEEPDAAFDPAVKTLLAVAATNRLDRDAHASIEQAMGRYAPDRARRYALGAVLLAALSSAGEAERGAKLSGELASEFAANESKIPPSTFGGSVAPAIIYFQKGESERRAGRPAEAMASYETVLAAYPYNEWPDAAAYGLAECFAALGDAKTARERFQELAKADAKLPASRLWQERAKVRLTDLEKGD